jgi:hypothetical protein
MGYHTSFWGFFSLNKPLHPDLVEWLRNVNEGLIPQAEVIKTPRDGYCCWQYRQEDDAAIISPPDERGKHYGFVQWLTFIMDKLSDHPDCYVLNGTVRWMGEDGEDYGLIVFRDNKLFLFDGSRLDQLIEREIERETLVQPEVKSQCPS